MYSAMNAEIWRMLMSNHSFKQTPKFDAKGSKRES